jgi:hypothetical protein
MPKLYHNGQLEGWQTPGKQDKHAARIDVPSSPEELAAWLNHRRVGPSGAAAEAERQAEPFEGFEADLELHAERQLASAAESAGNPNRCAVCKSRLIATEAGADKAAISRELAAIAEWITTAPTWAIERLTEYVATRPSRRRPPSRGGRIERDPAEAKGGEPRARLPDVRQQPARAHGGRMSRVPRRAPQYGDDRAARGARRSRNRVR